MRKVPVRGVVACCVWFSVCLLSLQASDRATTYSVGVARMDITPDYPVRLSGFGSRRTESEGVTQPIWAKSLAISVDADDEPVVLITVDNLGIPASICDEVATRLAAKTGLKRSRLAITASHTHTAPMLRGVAATLYGSPIPDDQQRRIDRYTSELTDKLEQLALAAINDRRSARLTWGIGTVGFALNRRTKDGPVDHDLPLLVVKGMDGQVRAIYVSYACHCVTLSNNKISGDWAGYAQELIQREFPSAMALVSIGCGADQNPATVTSDKTDVASQQGAMIAAEVKRLLGGFLAPVTGAITDIRSELTLEFAEPATRAQWEEKARQNSAAGYHARVQLERLTGNGPLPTTLDYPVASWAFGDSLAMVFLPGEVVVDYSRRLKKELDGRRLWINAYANDAPCYIPSERILAEGGYEGGDAMVYYDRPGPLKAGVESRIVAAVHQQLDGHFLPPFNPDGTRGSLPKSPQQSLAAIRTTPNLRVDLVVAEPLISDPVAIDFGLDGSLWVAEMRDYPMGLQPAAAGADSSGTSTDHAPGGRIRLVRDLDGDGQFDSSTVFLEGIPFPTGVTVWRDGVLICSAPDILFAADRDGDGRADIVEKRFSGFGTTNNQARVNSLCYGLDGWVHGSCGLFGGTITNFKGEKFDLGDRDFRIKPDTGEIEAATGRTQQGRVRDDFGNWFGCDNSNLAFHYPLAEHYLKRNPYVAAPQSRVHITQSDASRQLFPARADVQRFQLSGPPGTVTAACGIGIYHDSRLGPGYHGNVFTCEPVNLLVHRLELHPHGSSFIAERADNESETEFLRSTDAWFRPVQAVTGPDGGLWVVDMYRFIIEDPRWIPAHELAPLDVRAGSSLGRIYRVMNAADQTPPARRASMTSQETGPAIFDTKTSPVYQELQLQRLTGSGMPASTPERDSALELKRHGTDGMEPGERVLYYRRLAASQLPGMDDVEIATRDPSPGVRALGVLLAELHSPRDALPPFLIQLAMDDAPHVRQQVACSLGHWDDPAVGPALAKLALRDADDPYIVGAVFSSLTPGTLAAFSTTLFAELNGKQPPPSLMAPFLATAAGYSDSAAIHRALIAIARRGDQLPLAWQLNAITNLVEALARRPAPHVVDAQVDQAIRRTQEDARDMAVSETLDEETRMSAINLLGRDTSQQAIDIQRLALLLSSRHPPTVQMAAVEALERIASDTVPELLASDFAGLSPIVQTRILDALMSREAWLLQLFAEIARGAIPATALNAAQRQELVAHPDQAIRERAIELLATTINLDRQQIIEQYRVALSLTGDVDRGRTVFTKTCSQCHRLGDIGHAVGPNLAMVANKTPSFLLQELLDPNRNVDTRYSSYVAVTRAGLTRTGILSSESSSSLTLLATEGKQYSLLRTDLEELRASGKSLMPEGLEKDLSQQAVADVIAFLGTMPAASKQIKGNSPVVVKPVSGRLALPATAAAIYGDQITFEPPLGNIGYWHGPQDHVSWSIDLPAAGQFDVYLDYACAPGSAGNSYRLEAGSASLLGRTISTGGWDQYTLAKAGLIDLVAGPQRIVLRPDAPAIRGALMDLRGLHMVPVGEAFTMTTPPAHPLDSVAIAEIARQILDEKRPESERETLISQYSDQAAELIAAMTLEMPGGTIEEYRRIPWIWRIAVARGKAGQVAPLQGLLEVSLPQPGQPLRDWQAVVIGGGIINGIGLNGSWPAPRMEATLKDRPELKSRWQFSLVRAAQMADNEKIPAGTRYDALRMVALGDWTLSRPLLSKYLAKGIHDELQMGAISGLSDVEAHEVPRLLLENLGHLNDENRALAVDALTRNDLRSNALLDAIATRQIPRTSLNSAQRTRLRESRNPSVRARALIELDE
jgi:putative membrane-bound dehydrogenase-like protein